MDFQEISKKLDKADDLYHKMIQNIAETVFEETIKPFLIKRRLSFHAGMGSYSICTSCPKKRTIFLYDHPSEKFCEISEILEIYPDGQSLGSLMPDYEYER